MGEAQVLPMESGWWWIEDNNGRDDLLLVVQVGPPFLIQSTDGTIDEIDGDEFRWLERMTPRTVVAALRAERDAAQDTAAQAVADFDRVVRERNEARAALARIYVESGGDTDYNDPTTPDGIEHLWRRAEAGVRELRQQYDEAISPLAGFPPAPAGRWEKVAYHTGDGWWFGWESSTFDVVEAVGWWPAGCGDALTAVEVRALGFRVQEGARLGNAERGAP